MRNDNQRNNKRIDIRDFCGGDYLKVSDIDGPMVVTIAEEFVAKFEHSKPKVALRFREIRKALPLNTENGEALAELLGSPYPDEWCGQQIGLYINPNVKNSRQEVTGGIRVTSAEKVRERLNGAAGRQVPVAAQDPYSEVDEFIDW